MRKFITSILIAAAAMTACVQNDDFVVNNTNDTITLTAHVTAPEARTVLVDDGDDVYHAEWAVGDKVDIYEVTETDGTRAKSTTNQKNGIEITVAGKTATITETYKVLDADSQLKGKVYITPNSIQVNQGLELAAKKYEKIAFVGNLIPTKGIYELVEAVKQCSENTTLTIVGPGDKTVISHIKQLAGELIDKRVKLIGSLPNEQAVEMIKSMDVVALPTYYPSEAFPISILEAMSYGKMVISTPRAAVKDMLTAVDGTECGYLVRERSVEDIVEAIKWCQQNKEMADERCAKAYEKVNSCYCTNIVYGLYRCLYRKAIMD